MNGVLGFIIALVVIIAIYYALVELYNAYDSVAYIGTAIVVIASYLSIGEFRNAHQSVPWLIMFGIILILGEACTFLLKKYEKTYLGLIMLTCAVAGGAAFRLIGLYAATSMEAVSETLVLTGMNCYALWAGARRNTARVHDRGNQTTGIIAAVMTALTMFFILNWAYIHIWCLSEKRMHIVLWRILQIVLSIVAGIIWIVFDNYRDNKRQDRYNELAGVLTLARDHYMTLLRDLDGILDSVPKDVKKAAKDSTNVEKGLKRFKQLKNIEAEKVSFFEYNDMLKIYPVLKDAFCPVCDEEEKHTLCSVYFQDLEDKDNLTYRYKQLIKLLRSESRGGDREIYVRLKQEYDEQIKKFK